VDDLTFKISFQSDRNNFAGGRAAIWIHGSVESRALGRWRKRHEHPWIGGRNYFPAVATGQIGNLREPKSWMEWNFADPTTREAMADDAVMAIREIIFPVFANFDDLPVALEMLSEGGFQALWAAEFAFARAGREAAEKLIRSFFAHHPDLREAFKTTLKRYRSSPLPEYRSDIASDLAVFVVAAGLDFSDIQ
jgi:hypothetical protein